MATNWSKFRYKEEKKEEDLIQETSATVTPEEAKTEKESPVNQTLKDLNAGLDADLGLSEEDKKIVDFDKSHLPAFNRAWFAVKNPLRDIADIRAWHEKATIFKIKTMPELTKNDRTGFNHIRTVLLKSPKDNVEDIMKATVDDLSKDKRPEHEKPRLVVIGPNQEVDGVPVTVEKYLRATKAKSLEEEMYNREDRSPVFEAVYDADKKDRMKYAATYLEGSREFYKEKKDPERSLAQASQKEEKRRKEKKKEAPVQVIAGKIVHDDHERLDLEGELIRTNAYVYGQDMAEENQTGVPVRDTVPITDTHNIKTQERTQIMKARTGEEVREADPIMAPEKDLVDKDKDGIPDIFEYYDENDNGIDDRFEGIAKSEAKDTITRDAYDPEWDDPNYEPADSLGKSYWD